MGTSGNVLLQAVDGVSCTVVQRLLQLCVINITDDNAVRMEQLNDAQNAASQCTAAYDHHIVDFFDLCAGAALHGNGSRLDHDGFLIGQHIRHQIAVLVWHSHVLTIAAVNMDTAHAQVAADIGAALAAGVTVAAGHHLIHDHAVAYLDLGSAFTDFYNVTHDLMADDAGIGGRCVSSLINANIGAADARCGNLDQNIVHRVDTGFFHIDHMKFTGLYNLNSFHTSNLHKSCAAEQKPHAVL